MGKTFIDLLEQEELLQKLKDAGYANLIDGLLDNESAYTKKGKLNKSSACRVLGMKTKQLEEALLACRELLGEQ